MSIASKFRTLHKIISNGQYGAIPWRILANILPGEIVRNMIHYSLSRKYRPLISANISAKVPATETGHENIIWRLWL